MKYCFLFLVWILLLIIAIFLDTSVVYFYWNVLFVDIFSLPNLSFFECAICSIFFSYLVFQFIPNKGEESAIKAASFLFVRPLVYLLTGYIFYLIGGCS